MKPENKWEEVLQNEIERIAEIYITSTEFGRLIRKILDHQHCLLAGLQYAIECPSPFEGWDIGIASTGEPDSRTYNPGDNRSTSVRIKYWLKEERATIKNPTLILLEKLFSSFWKPSIRTEKAGIPSCVYAQNMVEDCKRNGLLCSMLFCDLDNFKTVNTLYLASGGDLVIKKFGAILEKVARKTTGIVLHRSGDEFIILTKTATEGALLLAYNIYKAFTSYDFELDDVSLGLSIGVTAFTNEDETFAKLENDANNAMNNVKADKKGRARFVTANEIPIPKGNLEYKLNLAHCILRSSITSENPFANVWLNCLSTHVSSTVKSNGCDYGVIEKAIKDFMFWADIELLTDETIKSSVPREFGVDNVPSAGAIDYCFSIAHGLLRANIINRQETWTLSSVTIKYSPDLSNVGLVCNDGEKEHQLWSLEASAEMTEEFEIGPSWELESKDTLVSLQACRAILIQIGHGGYPGMPLSLFADRIIVDDRPVRGGGLPDFWEATIARLVTKVLNNPNIAAVYVVGNYEYAKRTVEKLKGIASWAADDGLTSYKTAMSTQDIQTAVSLLDGKIRFITETNEIIADFANVLRAGHEIKPVLQDTELVTRRFLRREVQLNEMALGKYDGCRVKTIAEAYPLVMEIARKAPEENSIIDQAGCLLRELVDFKVNLTNPCQDMVPTFYKNEKDSLDEYYEREFQKPTGLFGKVFHETKQLDAVISHMANSMSDPNNTYATRRAILVVPHNIEQDKEIAPLGLVSIRIISRFDQNQIRLHYSYTWRSVEAFVGFPYSLYGSVKFGNYLTDEIKKRLKPEQQRFVQMGYISYIAHSLHLFIDVYGQNIARRIIDDASY